jgi:hypothetical protein
MSPLRSSMSRRKFFDLAASAAGGALAAGRRPAAQSGPRGANDRVRMALIGSGSRGRGVAATFVRNHTDVQYVAACDAYRMRLDQGVQQLTERQKNVKVPSATRTTVAFSTGPISTPCSSRHQTTGTARY